MLQEEKARGMLSKWAQYQHIAEYQYSNVWSSGLNLYFRLAGNCDVNFWSLLNIVKFQG